MTQKNSLHWNEIYSNKVEDDLSWFQREPTTSVYFIEKYGNPSESFIDVGCGTSTLVDELVKRGFENLTLLDISAQALEIVKQRIPDKNKITFIASDVLQWQPEEDFQIWHDRAVFHFLTEPEEISAYQILAKSKISHGGILILGTFALDGPPSCSGYQVSQYSAETIRKLFEPEFELIDSLEEIHETPWQSKQNFTWTAFRRV